MTTSAAFASTPEEVYRGGGIVTTHCITSLPQLERELHDGVLREWKAVVQADPLASVFQSPGWCIPWYRSYNDEFDPFVVAVMQAGVLAGVVPLAVRRSTREIDFASGTMADYRDIVSLPQSRAVVVDELLRVYVAGRFPNPLQIGWIDPASNTPALVATACRARGIPTFAWQQPCYRWTPVAGENLNKKFSRVRTHLNHFKRLGNVTFDVVSDADGWAAFRTAFFEQHTLRQLQADRAVSFDDLRKRRFYDRLFDSTDVQLHATALRLDGELLSGHVGLLWRDVLMLGAPSISIEHEPRSPALVLLSWIIQNAGRLGLKGLDLTIGDTEFKRRLGNGCVRVTAIQVYGSRASYHARLARREATAIVKGVTAAALGKDGWNTKVRPVLDRAGRRLALAQQRGVAAAVQDFWHRDGGARQVASTREITREDLRAFEDAGDTAWQIHNNRVHDLLRWNGTSAETDRAIRRCARSYARERNAGATLHTLCVDGALAGWCFSRRQADNGVATIKGLNVTEAFRSGDAGRALLARVAQAAFDAGATRVLLQQD